VPEFHELRADIEAAEREIATSQSQLANLQGALKLAEDGLREALRDLIPAPKDFSDIEKIIAELQPTPEETRLVALASTRRDIDAALAEWNSFSSDPLTEEREVSEQAHRKAQTALNLWQENVGAALSKLVAEVSAIFPDLKLPSSTNPEQARAAALRAVQKELERCSSLLEENDRVGGRLTSLDEDLAKILSREKLLDNELQAIGATTGELAQQLAALLPHVHSDDCPVCGRDYSEVAAVPLASHISSRISALTERAARLESLSKERAVLTGRRAALEREQSELRARQISLETANELKVRRARLSELAEQLTALADASGQGMTALASVQAASAKLDQLRSRDQRITNLHSTIVFLTKALNVSEEPTSHIGEALKRLQVARSQQEEALTKMKARRSTAIQQAREFKALTSEIASSQQSQNERRATLERLQEAKGGSDQVILAARALATKAADIRTGIVRRVFNESLNAIWRDLFVRLAPEENFVPAFALPDTSGPVEAMLETIYRSGGKGGNPRAMLSAGNLNTAALTLFLSLHLTAKPQLPWLIIDDPVQSMDELHIAQFAVLLRTLSKAHNRQIILAVHERALFEYLSLELSPAFPDDRLITLELGRAADGSTTHEWKPHTYEPDRAIAA
jgi:exonuclease SbcC